MDGFEHSDVIAAGPSPRHVGLPILAAACALSLVVGVAAGSLLVDGGDALPSDDVEPRLEVDLSKQAEGGLVHVCDGRAHAFVFASGLAPARTEVLLPLRGDSGLLPILTESAEVMTGVPEGHQYFVPQDGHLALVQQIAVPQAAPVTARLGDRNLTLPVRDCGG